jgi:enamine deaminase RidA (YjgF/YER057c/UK114 family)
VSELEQIKDVSGLISNPHFHWASIMGDLVFTSGHVAWDENGRVVGLNDPRAQAEQAFANLERTLEAAGSSLALVGRLMVFITEPSALVPIREVKARWLPTAPASTFVYVSGLVDPDLILELEVIAVRG